jgi:uncharacterized protein YndB with AHSA1/START domain
VRFTRSPEPRLEEAIVIAATPARVWALVTDLSRMSAWSPQVVLTRVRGGAVGLGTRAINLNRRGYLFWPTTTRVVAFQPVRRLALRVTQNRTVWAFDLEPDDGGTRLVLSREAPQGIAPSAAAFTRLLLGGKRGFTDELQDGMRSTLSRIQAEAERRSSGASPHPALI